jgi:hypothetical protein
VSFAVPHLRRGFSLLSAFWLVFLLEPLSSTGLAFPFFLVTFAVTVLFGVASLGLVLTRRPVSRRGMLAWLVHPLAAGALLVLFLSSQSPGNPFFRLRFHLSRPALEDARRVALSQGPGAVPAWVGLFPVRRVEVHESEVRFISDGCGVIDECGLVYLPGPIPTGRSKTRLTSLGGPWYHLYAVF